jgi:hypothetical protein
VEYDADPEVPEEVMHAPPPARMSFWRLLALATLASMASSNWLEEWTFVCTVHQHETLR